MSNETMKSLRQKVADNMEHTPGLKETRIKNGLAQLDLALKARVGVNTVSRLERGRPARRSTVEKLAQALGIEKDILLSDSTLK